MMTLSQLLIEIELVIFALLLYLTILQFNCVSTQGRRPKYLKLYINVISTSLNGTHQWITQPTIYIRIMRRSLQKIAEYNILTEILVRAILLTAVCIMQLGISPYIQYITDTELLNDYKRPRRDSYVPVWLLVCLIIIGPLLFMSLALLLTRDYFDSTQAILAWTLSLSLNAIITETLKLIVGRPRPDFYYRCFPNGKKTAECTGPWDDVMEGRKSFPSGHSSFSFCSLGFLSLWLCGKLGLLSRSRGQGLRVVACLVPLMIASVVALSRYCDNHHHWEDVFVGSLLGFVSCYFCYRQYFHPLDSEFSGQAYETMSMNELFGVNSQTQCCTKNLNSMPHISTKKILESNKKYT